MEVMGPFPCPIAGFTYSEQCKETQQENAPERMTHTHRQKLCKKKGEDTLSGTTILFYHARRKEKIH